MTPKQQELEQFDDDALSAAIRSILRDYRAGRVSLIGAEEQCIAAVRQSDAIRQQRGCRVGGVTKLNAEQQKALVDGLSRAATAMSGCSPSAADFARAATRIATVGRCINKLPTFPTPPNRYNG